MGLFNTFSKKNPKPYKQDAYNAKYDLLFCDDIELYKSETKSSGYPWNILFAKNPDIGKLKVIAGTSTIDSRHKVLAYNMLLSQGVVMNNKEPLGVIVEVAQPAGLDVIAAYSDGTVRYINHTGKMTAWETRTDAVDQIISRLFADSVTVIDQIERLDLERKSFPQNGRIKLTFLVSDGMYFWEGHFDLMHKDSLAGPVIDGATNLLTHLSSR